MRIGFDLLDRRIVDGDGRTYGKVSDVELTYDNQGFAYVSALLVARRIRTIFRSRPAVRIPARLIARIDGTVHLKVAAALLPAS